VFGLNWYFWFGVLIQVYGPIAEATRFGSISSDRLAVDYRTVPRFMAEAVLELRIGRVYDRDLTTAPNFWFALMLTLLIAVGSFFGFIIAYNTYGRWLSKKIFELNPDATVPSIELEDGRDFVPTSKSIVFGHHFTSIAGTGPIVGPAVAIMWGWVPALLWVLFGSVLIGAVHDFGALVVSLRNRGQTIGDVAGRLIHPRVRFLFLTILLFALWIVLAIFGLVIASVFRMFPASILPVFLQIPIAVLIGLWLHRKGANILLPSVIALALMYLTVWLGAGGGGAVGQWVQSLNASLAEWSLGTWTAILLAYCFVASVLPVWTLLQPRDYINSLQLIATLALVMVGLIAAGLFGVNGQPLTMVAPAVEWSPTNAPPIFPFLFITIACGAISGFHCLVSSGTTSKQLKCESDAQFVAYGSMLTEGFLAVIVILAVGAGIGFGWADHNAMVGSALWGDIYGDWAAANKGLGVKVGAFVAGSANFIVAIGIGSTLATTIMAVMVASFAGTTLDTATRLQRYVIQELGRSVQETLPALRPATLPFTNMYGATGFAVVSAFVLAAIPYGGDPWAWSSVGKGAMSLWPMFGATNQLLGGLAFLVISFWLWRRRKPVWFAILPAFFMLVMPAWAMLSQVGGWVEQKQYVLVFVAIATIVLEIWMIFEAVFVWPKAKGVLEEALPPLPQRKQAGSGIEGGRSC